jgi:hypothetical protein
MYAGQLHILPTTPEAGEIIADWNLDEINHLLRTRCTPFAVGDPFV